MSGVWLASFVVLWLIVLVLAFLLAGALRQLGLGALLVSGLVPVFAAVGAIALFAVFAAALAVSLARSNRAPCHCFGASDVFRVTKLLRLRDRFVRDSQLRMTTACCIAT